MELASRFSDAYIVRSHKETEEIIAEADVEFFRQPLSYFKKHKDEYIYVESKWFEALGVDAVSLELDDLFKTYGVMIGLKQKKNVGPAIKSFLEKELEGESLKYAAMFNGDEGIWDINFSLDYVKGFSDELTIGESYLMIHQLLFKLVTTLEEK
ncbi:branched-chain amino acid aminotransferase [Cytobacillus suaedae]|nr:branched-chain amino acid aminotransferase [Cytobacillus suaedae]